MSIWVVEYSQMSIFWLKLFFRHWGYLDIRERRRWQSDPTDHIIQYFPDLILQHIFLQLHTKTFPPFLPLILNIGIAIKFQARDRCPQGRLTLYLHFFGKTASKLADKAKEIDDFLFRFDHIILIMIIKLILAILEPILIDLVIIFELEFDVDGRIANIFYFDLLLCDVVDGNIETQLQFVYL